MDSYWERHWLVFCKIEIKSNNNGRGFTGSYKNDFTINLTKFPFPKSLDSSVRQGLLNMAVENSKFQFVQDVLKNDTFTKGLTDEYIVQFVLEKVPSGQLIQFLNHTE